MPGGACEEASDTMVFNTGPVDSTKLFFSEI